MAALGIVCLRARRSACARALLGILIVFNEFGRSVTGRAAAPAAAIWPETVVAMIRAADFSHKPKFRLLRRLRAHRERVAHVASAELAPLAAHSIGGARQPTWQRRTISMRDERDSRANTCYLATAEATTRPCCWLPRRRAEQLLLPQNEHRNRNNKNNKRREMEEERKEINKN